MINTKENYLWLIGILETIKLCINKWALACLKCYLQSIRLRNHTSMYEPDLALNNLQGLKSIKPNQV